MIFGKNLNQIHYGDIERLISNKIPEGMSIEYKSKLDIATGDQRKEFLYDVTAFANSEGGLILYGIAEEVDEAGKNTGIPDQIVGLAIDNDDLLLKQLDDIATKNMSFLILPPEDLYWQDIVKYFNPCNYNECN